MDGYPICKMEAFAESIVHLTSLEDRRFVVNAFVAAQGDNKSVQDYLKSLEKLERERKGADAAHDADELLAAFKGGFKGL